jgi:DNA ligase (NAD+)
LQVTQIENIVINTGRTGKITYRGLVKPILIDGTLVKAATLHNAEYIKKHDIRIGDYVTILKAGGIIPEIKGALPELRSQELIK